MGVEVTTARPLARLAATIAVFAMLATPSPAGAARQQQNRQTTPKKVWTNEDVQRLKDRDAISVVGIGSDIFDVDEPAPTAQGAKTKVWTNDDLQKLRAPDALSVVPSAEQAPAQPAAPPAAAAAAAPAATEQAPYDEFTDPNWYAQQAYALRQQLEDKKYELDRYAQGVAQAQDRITQPGISMSNWGYVQEYWVTPQAGLQDLQTDVGEAEIALENLRELARRNGIPSGVLRDE